VSAGEALRLGCPVDSNAVGRSAPIITWYKDGDEVSVGWERYRARHDALYVRDMEPDDSGVFVCRATNGFGSVDVKYLVLVLAGQLHLRQHALSMTTWAVCSATPGYAIMPVFAMHTESGDPLNNL